MAMSWAKARLVELGMVFLNSRRKGSTVMTNIDPERAALYDARVNSIEGFVGITPSVYALVVFV